MNDASLLKRIPVIHGSIFRFEGQVTVFDPYNGPCYRCLIPEPPPAELAPSCSEAGVLGVLPGIIGSIQAVETIKVLLGLGDPLIGRLLAYDALEESFRTFKVRRDPACPACGPDAGEIIIAEYDDLCMPHALSAHGAARRHVGIEKHRQPPLVTAPLCGVGWTNGSTPSEHVQPGNLGDAIGAAGLPVLPGRSESSGER